MTVVTTASVTATIKRVLILEEKSFFFIGFTLFQMTIPQSALWLTAPFAQGGLWMRSLQQLDKPKFAHR
jgi:hypothetical protein